MTHRDAIAHNIAVHNRIAEQYQAIHTDIFNPIEQARLYDSLARAKELIRTESDSLRALDFGCGTGNVTAHLLELGFHVTVADVAERFLEMLSEKYAGYHGVDTFKLNGEDLAGLDDASFELIATYSVLHHVPDYLGALRELARVTKPGGILYLDHEVNEHYWERSETYRRFRRRARTDRRFFRRLGRWTKKRLGLIQRRDEGDIHVTADDHIEWDRIEQVLRECSCDVVLSSDYLLYDARYDPRLFDQYKDQLTDYRCMAFRKR